MKEFVIEFTGEQFCTLICALEYTRDKYDLYRAEEFTKEVEDLRKEIYKQELPQYHGKKITICEVDLEEENRVLKKALELACEKISSWEMNMPKDKMKDYFIQQAKGDEDEMSNM